MAILHKLTYVRKEKINSDIYTFYFLKPKKFIHNAGQHGIFFIPGLYRPHPFTLSSAPEEKYIAFSTHVDTGSKFKRNLMQMSKGRHLFLFGPILSFTLSKKNQDYVLLAQGIGITPFRSMLIGNRQHAQTGNITLIHIDNKSHSFKALTEQYATNSYYPTHIEEFQKITNSQNIEQLFYISGSPRFIKSTRKLLIKNGVGINNIKTDSFLGY